MYDIIKISNGLRVVLEEIDYVNSVSVGLWVKNGSRNENKDNSGISHFIEHMFFKGTEKRNAKEIAQSIEDVGGQINAFTAKEATCYYVKILDTHLDLALDVISDMIFNSKFDEEEIEKEKGVVIEEINMNEDSPEDVLIELHSKAIWGDDPIALPILGNENTVDSFTKKILLDYISSRYIPENCVLSIAGKFNKNDILKIVEDYFGDWKFKGKNLINYSAPKILTNHLFKEKQIEQLHISLGLTGIELGSDDLYPLLFLNNILGGGASSILFQKIREELGRCYSIYSYLSALNNTGVVSIYTGLNPKYSTEVVTLIKEELEKFTKIDISNDRIMKGKEQLKGSYILGLESTSSRMFNNGKSVLFLDRINEPEVILKKIDTINKDRIYSVMDKTFKKGILNSAYVGEDVDLNLMKNIIENTIYPFNNKPSTLI